MEDLFHFYKDTTKITVSIAHNFSKPLDLDECPEWVDSCRLAKSYIRISCTSAFGTTTDIRLTPGMDM